MAHGFKNDFGHIFHKSVKRGLIGQRCCAISRGLVWLGLGFNGQLLISVFGQWPEHWPPPLCLPLMLRTKVPENHLQRHFAHPSGLTACTVSFGTDGGVELRPTPSVLHNCSKNLSAVPTDPFQDLHTWFIVCSHISNFPYAE